jgi:hypothetical protein
MLFMHLSGLALASRGELTLDHDTTSAEPPPANEVGTTNGAYSGGHEENHAPGDKPEEETVSRFLHTAVIADILAKKVGHAVEPTAHGLASSLLQLSDGDVGNFAKYALKERKDDGASSAVHHENSAYFPEDIGSKFFGCFGNAAGTDGVVSGLGA